MARDKSLISKLFGSRTAKNPAVAEEPDVPSADPAERDRETRNLRRLVEQYQNGFNNIVDALGQMNRAIRRGADVNAKNDKGETLLLQVCDKPRSGSEKIAERLIEAKADVNVALPDGDTALLRAAAAGNFDMLRALLDAGADVKAVKTEPPRAVIGDAGIGGGERDIFHNIIVNRFDEPEDVKTARRECLKLLMDRGHQPSKRDLFSVYCNRPHLRPLFPGIVEARVLADAAERGDGAMVEEMLSRGVKPDSGADFGANAAVIEAIGKGHKAIVKTLLDAGASLNLISPQHYVTPLQQAAWAGDKETFEDLLARGAEPGDADSVKRIMFMAEGRNGMQEYVKTALTRRDLKLQRPITAKRFQVKVAH